MWVILGVSLLFLFILLYQVHNGSKTAIIFLFSWLISLFVALAFFDSREEAILSSTPTVLVLVAIIATLFALSAFKYDVIDKYHEDLNMLVAESNKRVDAERIRISRELHDTINQRLIVSKLRLEDILVTENLNTELDEEIKYLLKVNQEAFSASRSIIHSIRVEVLDAVGLYGSLEDLVSHYNSAISHMRFSFKGDAEALGRIKQEHRIHIYRVIQEALLNAVKHAQADRVTITAELMDKKRLRICIKDNGIGFDTQKKVTGIGLIDMRQRAQLANSNLITLSSSQGTEIALTASLLNQVATEMI